MKRQKPSKDKLQSLYWDKQMTLQSLGAYFGVDGSTIRNWMISYDIPRRDVSAGKPRSRNHAQAISQGQKRLAKSGQRRYDKEHSPAWKGGKVTVHCSWCDAPKLTFPVFARKQKNHFCKGTDCRSKWLSENIPKRQYDNPNYGSKRVPCDNCGKVIQRNNSSLENKEHVFCSTDCLSLFGNDELICENCSKKFLRPKHQQKGERVFCNNECQHAWFRGNNASNWQGGHAKYYGPNWNEQRDKARKRDGYTCQVCDVTEIVLNRQLDIHHINFFSEFGLENYKQANRLTNLTCLCQSCHTTLHNKHRWNYVS